MLDLLDIDLLHPVSPSALTETVHASVPLHLKNAVSEAAQRNGTSVARYIRDALSERISSEETRSGTE